jgi:predicted RNase H-like HicB family nuclease
MKFTIKIWKEDGWYIARCPELSTTQGKTLTEIKKFERSFTVNF